MIPYLGDFAEDSTVYVPFNTFTSDDPSASATITNLADADIKVHKDGSVFQIVTDGATVAIDFDSITGNHLITIDTSAHADYATGSDYLVRIEGTTVDGATINAFVAQFSIENRYSAGALRPTTAGRTLDVTATGAAGIDWGNVENQTTAVDLSATDIQLADTVTTVTDGAKATELAKVPKSDGTTTWNATALASINAEVDTAMGDYDAPTKAEMDTAFTEIKGATFSGATDTLEAIRDRGDAAWTTGAGGSAPTAADIRAEIDANSTQLAAIVADTNELQSDDVPGLIATLDAVVDTVKSDTVAILVDTGTTLPATLAALPAATDIVSGGAITTAGGIADVNVQKINDVTIIGDGNATPFNV